MARPRARFSSLSTVCCALLPAAPGAPEALDLRFTLRNSSVSARTRFMCLSKASIWPTSCLPSFIVTRILWLMKPVIFPCLFDADMLGVGRAWARLGFLGVLEGRRGADRATRWTSR